MRNKYFFNFIILFFIIKNR